jgi:S-DNA-T family DNA segregation ATPase FtsK/SpoIIIE
MSAKERQAEIEKLVAQSTRSAAEAQVFRDAWLKAAEAEQQQRSKDAAAARSQAMAAAGAARKAAIQDAEIAAAAALAAAESQREAALAAIETNYADDRATIDAALAAILSLGGPLAANWDDAFWQSWHPNGAQVDGGQWLTQTGVRLGKLDEAGPWDTLTLPAMLPFLGQRSLLVTADADQLDVAVDAAQSLLLRLLAAVPAGKLRFTFFDPVGLGQNVAPFMHLADYDDALVTARAWTEPHHIEQRLAALTEHMENVIQKYLRNQYADIEAYNAHAGEVAEPYRVLVVNDFPVGFSENSARRLVSILQNGARCGVYAVVVVDLSKFDAQGKTPALHDFNLADLKRVATVLAWEEGGPQWIDAEFAGAHFELDAPPPPELFNSLVNRVGQAAKDAARVEVPFARIIPPVGHRWTADAAAGVHVALGPAGARRFQYLELGKGTAQHVLVAGKTGSGKSTLLHVLITNLALHYSPEQVEFYLIDFKKGVEFKSYAVHSLPHARVVAIESEREFGLSVLIGLDAELKRRGDLFRSAQVDNLAAYRKAADKSLPRILLLVDEFQEFFSEDDPIASQSSQLLDRLVRQGRAFGIHVVLGSQTLAGAYSLARSTIDQMAVRVALQCSEADSRLILADDNAAARLLSRPGEAIYNDANGRFEGNNPFQVAWLNDEERDVYLDEISQLALVNDYRPSRPQIIFEGNAPARLEQNAQLLAALANYPPKVERPRRLAAWLGDPIAIKDATAAYFRRQSGSHLLIVGQDDESASGMLAAALVSLAAQLRKTDALFDVLDFTPVDLPHADLLKLVTETFPHPSHWGRRRELPDMIDKITIEMNRRLAEADAGGAWPSIFLVVNGVQRAKDLRLEEMGYGGSYASFSSSLDEPAAPPPAPGQQFATILQQGPEVGIHVLAWCDTMTNLNRILERRSIREFEMRVAFQMSADDSANLIDTPAAAKLGPYRALLVSDEEARQEKFRPYRPPAAEWLAQLRIQLAGQAK